MAVRQVRLHGEPRGRKWHDSDAPASREDARTRVSLAMVADPGT